ncbi:MAG: threonine/serine dehydratase [Candidatus Bathyarchaeota archaeon]|nr:MAG: threonine/serine dehydratase [Candidatus Bathyarchaeota archaeon]
MFREVKAAYERIRNVVNTTPVMTSSTLNQLAGCSCFFKCENFQKTGSFKFRGAYNALSQLSHEQKKRGVITHSSGNHAQALALAARILGIKAIVVMPEDAAATKVSATRNYGAEIVTCGSHPEDREKAVEPLRKQYGYTLIHPSNNLSIIAGAGTAAYELMKQVDGLSYVFCPVGGGGLLSGTAIATKGLTPDIQVIGVEPKNADDAYRSLKAGKIIRVTNVKTVADGLRTSLGNHTFDVIKRNVDHIITVSEEEIIDAAQLIWERMKLVVEPSGAVSFAGVLSLRRRLRSRSVGVILSGGNIDTASFFETFKQHLGTVESETKSTP